jgi:hypothetical protein
MSDKPERAKYRWVAVLDGTYTVECPMGRASSPKRRGFQIRPQPTLGSPSRGERLRLSRRSDLLCL